MTHQDLKYLIGGFLILSLVTGSTTFLWSRFSGEPKPIPQTTITATTTLQSPEPSLPEIATNAPTEKIPILERGQLTEGSSTFTEKVFSDISLGIIQANPQGPAEDGAGGFNVASPNLDNVATKALFSPENAKSLTIPDWEAEAKGLSVNTIQSYKSTDIEQYAKSLNSILEKYFYESAVTNISGQQLSISTLSQARQALEQALKESQTLAVPEPLEGFHRSFQKLTLYEKNAIGLAADNLNDPLKATLIYNAQQGKLNQAIQEFHHQMSAVGAQVGLVNTNKRGLIAELLTHSAHAQFGLSIVFDPSNLAQMIKQWIYDTLVRILVNTLINKVQNDLVNWVAGNGNPKFITNWKDLLTKTGNAAAGSLIEKIAPRLCSDFRDLIKIQLGTSYNLAPEQQVSCTLDKIVGNIKSFYTNFQSGGWLAYGASALPSNDYFGSYFFQSQAADNANEKSKGIVQIEGQASAGFTGIKICKNSYTITVDESQKDAYDGNPNVNSIKCENGSCTVSVCIGDRETVTPGAAIAHSVFGASNWKIGQIYNASRLEELVAALFNAFINRLTNLALGALNNERFTTDEGVQFPTNVPNPAENPTSTTSGGGQQGGGTSKQDIVKSANNRMQLINETIDADSKWLSLYPNVVNILNQVVSSCKNTTRETEANTVLQQLSSTFSSVQNEISDLKNKQTQLQTLIGKIQQTNDTDTTKLTNLLNELQTQFDATTLQAALVSAQTRFDSLVKIQQDATADVTPLPGGNAACNVPLP